MVNDLKTKQIAYATGRLTFIIIFTSKSLGNIFRALISAISFAISLFYLHTYKRQNNKLRQHLFQLPGYIYFSWPIDFELIFSQPHDENQLSE